MFLGGLPTSEDKQAKCTVVVLKHTNLQASKVKNAKVVALEIKDADLQTNKQAKKHARVNCGGVDAATLKNIKYESRSYKSLKAILTPLVSGLKNISISLNRLRSGNALAEAPT